MKLNTKYMVIFFFNYIIELEYLVERRVEKQERKKANGKYKCTFYHHTTLYFLPTTSQSSPSSTVN